MDALPSDVLKEILFVDVRNTNSLMKLNTSFSVLIPRLIDMSWWRVMFSPLLKIDDYLNKHENEWKYVYVCLKDVFEKAPRKLHYSNIMAETRSIILSYRTYSSYHIYNQAMTDVYIELIEVLLQEEKRLTGNLIYRKLLSWTSKVGSVAIAKLLIDEGCYAKNPKTRRLKCDELLECAGKYGHLDMVKWLLDVEQPHSSFKYLGSCGNKALKKAAQKGHVEVVSYILNFRLQVTSLRCETTIELDNYILNKAAQSGYLEIVKLFTEPRHNQWEGTFYIADPSSENNYAIRAAARNGHEDVVMYLLSYKQHGELCVDPTSNNNEALRFATKNGFYWIVIALNNDSRMW